MPNNEQPSSPHSPLKFLGNISIDTFLREYWQKKPLLIKQAFPNFQSPVSADELAGFALEDEVVSRLAIENPHTEAWTLEHGPLPEDRFEDLPASHWTLLIQHADSLDEDVNALLQAFRFIPNWRLDDIMISYAPDKGGVGPHFDYFDVFLLQAEGQRRWRIGQRCDESSQLKPDLPMKVLESFDTQEDWIVEPGDLIYIPAQVAHWGEAIEESITYSIGFRAPSHAEFALDFTQDYASKLYEHHRYTDPDLSHNADAGEIPDSAIRQFQAILETMSQDKQMIAEWLGKASTQLKQAPLAFETPATEDAYEAGYPLALSPYCRVAYVRLPDASSEDGSRIQCFIDGDAFFCSLSFAKLLSNYDTFTRDITTTSSCANDDHKLILALLSQEKLISI